jgi:5-carboxymethyl-2-hydroxymuconate isomerase
MFITDMPHITLEYTTNLAREVAGPDLFARLHQVLVDAGGVDIGNCKSRAVALDTYLVGDGAAGSGFVHLDVRILEGQPADVKSDVGRRLLEALGQAYAAAPPGTQLTVELREMTRKQYFKLTADRA